MGLSKSTRITILLGIDSAFFFLELIVGMAHEDIGDIKRFRTIANADSCLGYAVHSLALVADSFHMVRRTSPRTRKSLLTYECIAKRCAFIMCRIMGGQSGEPEDKFKDVYIWGMSPDDIRAT